jgi:hypothetical protein
MYWFIYVVNRNKKNAANMIHNLPPSEVILTEDENGTNKYVLTNRSIMIVESTMFNQVKNMKKIPLSQIKNYNGQPSILLEKYSGTLKIQFATEAVEISLGTAAKANAWKEAITALLNDKKVDLKGLNIEEEMSAVEQAEEAGKTVGGMFSSFASGIFGKKEKEAEPVQRNTTVVKCKGCSNKISGEKGEVVVCEYCGSSNQL